KVHRNAFILSLLCILVHLNLFAQKDSANENGKRNRILQTVISTIKKDSSEIITANTLQRLDEKFKPFEDMYIREIAFYRFPFGIPIGDTSKKLITSLTELANQVHHQSKINVIK